MWHCIFATLLVFATFAKSASYQAGHTVKVTSSCKFEFFWNYQKTSNWEVLGGSLKFFLNFRPPKNVHIVRRLWITASNQFTFSLSLLPTDTLKLPVKSTNSLLPNSLNFSRKLNFYPNIFIVRRSWPKASQEERKYSASFYQIFLSDLLWS